jgi:hypothetical protein
MLKACDGLASHLATPSAGGSFGTLRQGVKMSETAGTQQRLVFSRRSIILTFLVLLAAGGISSTVVIKAAMYQNQVVAALSQSDYSTALALNVRNQLQNQSAAISGLRNQLNELASPTSGPPANVSQKAGAILDTIDDVDRANRNSDEAVKMWYDNLRTLIPPKPTALELTSRAYAAEQKKSDKSTSTPVQNPQPPPPPIEHPSKLGDLRWFLWALLAVPFFIGLLALYNVNSANAKAQDFCIATVGGVLGYYFGLGSSAFAVVLG